MHGTLHSCRRRGAGAVVLAACLAVVLGCDSDSWRPITREQRAERRLDYAVHFENGDALVVRFEEFLRNPEPPPDPDRPLNRRGLRVLLQSWREPADRQTDAHFRVALQRTAEQGSPLVMIPVRGDQFPVQVLYFRDETFFLIDRVEEQHMLFRCVLDGRAMIAAGSRHPWHPRIAGPEGGDEQSIRVYVFGGFVGPDRSTRMTAQHLADCLATFADNSHRVRRRIGDHELERVQQVHDSFFQVTR